MDWSWLAAAFAIAGVVSVVACYLVMAHLGVRDAPDNVRKLQEAPVPTSGGLGFAFAAVLAAPIVWIATGEWPPGDVAFVLVGAVMALVLGFIDDRWPVPATAKLLAMLAIAVGLVAVGVRADVLAPWPQVSFILPWVLAIVGSLTWIIVVVNAVNFMDGANGLAMGMAAIASAGLAICAGVTNNWDIAALAAALSGALAGFLVLNVSGRLFAGDAGALFAGATLAGLGLLLVRAEPELLFVPPLLLSTFLVDVLLTLIWRARRGRAWFSPHRDHAYQIALKAGMNHGLVSGIYAIWTLNAVGIAIVATLAGGYVPTVAGVLIILAGVWFHRTLRRFGEKSGLTDEDPATEA